MGLDIYFYTKQKIVDSTNPDTSDERIELGYFRKFNALFNWVNTHIKPIENCVDILISKEDLIKLQETLNQLNTSNCAELLPTQDGFFFGSTVYDEAYWEDVGYLKELISQFLEEFDFENEQIDFHAWW